MSEDTEEASEPHPEVQGENGASARQKAGLAAKWAPGQSGNPKGRAKGSRNKLAEDFLADLYADWQEGGIAALRAARESKPEIYCRIVASLLPKEISLKNELSEFTDEQLAALLAITEAMLRDGAQEDGDEEETKTVN